MSPIRIDFYLLKNKEQISRELLICRLIEKAYLRGHRIFVYCETQQDAEKIDELLWTFKEGSFIPHNLQGEGPEPPPPVQLGYTNEPRGFNDILVNLTPSIPVFYAKFKRIIEIVDQHEDAKASSRLRYREYRAAQRELYLHEV